LRFPNPKPGFPNPKPGLPNPGLPNSSTDQKTLSVFCRTWNVRVQVGPTIPDPNPGEDTPTKRTTED
ncbi:MAG: hypothetical protein V3T86_17505, partial [Planctomycetota bacterium]